jgi:hypothetical protein
VAVRVVINRASTWVQSREAAARLVREVLREVEAQAKAKTLGGPYSTGKLSNSIHSIGPEFTAIGVTGRVGTSLKYALSVERGAKVHWIFPKGVGGVFRFGSHRKPQLKFFWRKIGKIVYLPHIPGSPSKLGRSHPGQRGKHFLTEPLHRSARLHGMRVETINL